MTYLEDILAYKNYLISICDYLELDGLKQKLDSIKLEEKDKMIHEFDKIHDEILIQGEEYLVKNTGKIKGFIPIVQSYKK